VKVFLMYPDRDFDPDHKLPGNEQALIQDLELNTLFEAMALGDRFLFKTARQAVLNSLRGPDTIRYRQRILEDCLENPSVIRELYSIPIESIEKQKRHWMGIFSRYPSGILSSAVEMLEMFVVLLKKLRGIADEHAHRFKSDGFTRFFAMIQQELNDEYLALVDEHLQELRFRKGVLLSADLGKGNEGANHVLRRPNDPDPNWLKRILERSPVYSFTLHPRDDHGARALGELKDRVINLVANAAAQSADHIDSFFDALRQEMAFYVGCLNLAEQLAQMGEPISFPLPAASGVRKHSFTGLYDACLALTMQRRVVGNEVSADDKDLVIITGANQGGKSTFVRSIGLAQLMMQCGMFVPAESFSANVCDGLYTHFKREEDATMESGKLDEELGRMSAIVDSLTPNAMLLFNESFAATNEREGSEIARQVTRALLERRIKVFFVTHQYEFANSMYDRNMNGTIFLRAERQADGTRTFKLLEGEPLQTSYGQDLYHQIFGEAVATSGPPRPTS
jgi:DNA mismatch repair ATPase MutS